MKRCLTVVTVLILSLHISACSRGKRQDEDARLSYDSVVMELAGIQEQEGLSVAFERAVVLLPEMEEDQDRVQVILWLCHVGVPGQNHDLFLSLVDSLLAAYPDLARTVVSHVSQDMLQVDPDGWIAFLRADGKPADIQAHGHIQWLLQYGDSATDEALGGFLDLVLGVDFEPDQVRSQILGILVERSVQHAEAGRFWRVMEMLEERITPDASLRNWLLVTRGRGLMRDGRLQDVFDLYREHPAAFGDHALASGVRSILQQAVGSADATPLVAEVIAWAYGAAEYPGLRNAVFRWELQQLQGADQVDAVVATVKKGFLQDIPARTVASALLVPSFYGQLEAADADQRLALVGLLEALDTDVDVVNTPIHGNVATALLDTLFMLDDYAGVLARMEIGIPGYNEAWHVKMREKVAGHHALAEGRVDDAVAHFRAHIEHMRGWKDPILAPDTGRQYSVDELVAMNERRIGDILAGQAERADEAADAYARAQQHYRSALEIYSEEDPAYKEIVEALQALAPHVLP